MRLATLLRGGLVALLSSVSFAAVLPDERAPHQLEKRSNCGPGIGSCGNGMCCSEWGFCGTTVEYCGSGCQPGFGVCNPSPAYVSGPRVVWPEPP